MAKTYRMHVQPTGATWAVFIDLYDGSAASPQVKCTDLDASALVEMRQFIADKDGLAVDLYVLAGSDAATAAAFAAAHGGQYVTAGPDFARATGYLGG